MNPIARSLAFVVAALLSVGAAGLTYRAHSPVEVDGSAEIGEGFFPLFTDPNEATSLQVATFDKDASKTSTFSIENKDGKWRIPSHNNYPADGKDRLKSTAASVIGIKRGTLVGKSKEAHKLHNLLDPLDESVTETEGRGDRITLKKGDEILVDYIVGKKKEGSSNTYFIRKADEERFFLSEVRIELSTKFSDWIEPDLLDLKQDDVKMVLIDRYSVDEAQGVILQREQSVLNREEPTADWKIDEIDTVTLKPKSSVISAMLKSLDDLKIVGVRRKPVGLSSSLQEGDSIKITTSSRIDLQNRGYFFDPKKGIVSNEGDLLVSTFDGVSYMLRFGEVFSGSDIDVEVGSSKETEKKTAEEAKQDSDKPVAPTADPTKPTDAADPATKKNRFVFITAQFDEAALGPPPVEPKKPVEPKADAAIPEVAKPAEGEKPADPAAPVTPPQADAKAAYEKALQEYQAQSGAYTYLKKEFDDKKASGEKKAKALNARFADWYYVISEELFTELRVKPDDLVEPLVAAPEVGEEGLPVIPPLPSTPQTQTTPPAVEEVPAAEGAVPADPKVETPPAEGEQPPATEPPAVEGEKPAAPAEAPTTGAEAVPPANP